MTKSKIIPILLYIILASIVISIWWSFEKRNISEYRSIAANIAEQVALRIEDNIKYQLNSLDLLRTEWEVKPILAEKEFQNRVGKIMNSVKGFQSINYIETDGTIGFFSNTKGQLWGPRSYMSDPAKPIISKAFSLAQETGDIAISTAYPITAQEKGYIIFFPMKHNGEIIGYLNGVLNVNRIVNHCLARGNFQEFIFYLDDMETEIYNSGDSDQPGASEILGSYSVPVFNRFWTIYISLAPWAINELLSLSSKIILIAGLLIIFWISWTVKNYLELT